MIRFMECTHDDCNPREQFAEIHVSGDTYFWLVYRPNRNVLDTYTDEGRYDGGEWPIVHTVTTDKI